MPLISTSFPNLNGGVSQQPAAQRLETQCEAQENALPLIIGGLVKRPPTNYVGELKQSGGAQLDLTGSFLHFIQRDENEKYLLSVDNNGKARVHDLNGNIQTVHYPTGQSAGILYLQDGGAAKTRAVTIGDVTWILNTNTPPLMSSTVAASSTNDHEALLWIRSAGQGFKIKVSITVQNGGPTETIEISHIPQEITGSGSPAHLDPTPVRTIDVAEFLTNGGSPSSESGLTITYTTSSGSAPSSGINSFTDMAAIRTGSVIHIYSTASPAADFQITVEDSLGDNAHNLIKDKAIEFADLPSKARNGFIVEVEGNPETEVDDYYVKFETNAGTNYGDGLWVEVAEPGIKTSFDADKMPHVLVRQPDNSWVIKKADGQAPDSGGYTTNNFDNIWATLDWTDRNSGSELTNPTPSFITDAGTTTINDIVYFKGRLGLISGEYVSLSEAGEFFNFFRTTVTQLLDSAPIDVGVGGTDVNKLERAADFSDRLVLFSERAQFILQGVPILTPSTATITRATTFNFSGQCPPVPSGNTLFFPFSRGDYSGVREFYKTNETDINFDATESTLQVPRYIKGTITTMTASNHEDIMVIKAGDDDILYAYKFFRTPQGRIQSAWFKMTFPEANVLQVGFLQQSLFMVVKRGSKTFLERMDLQTGKVDTGSDYITHLDFRVQITGNGADTPAAGTVINLQNTARPDYELTSAEQALVQVVSEDGEQMTIDSVTATTITLKESFAATDKFWIGLPYTMRYELTKPTFKRTNQTGGIETIATGRHQLRYMTVLYDDSAFFTVKVTNEVADTDGTPIEYPFSGRFLSTGGFLGQIPSVDGKFRFPVFAESDAVKIEIENDSPFPSNIQSLQFEAQYTDRSQRQ